jgi:hypothetical protein
MPAPRDRKPDILEIINSALPLPPLNFFVFSALRQGTIDLRWTDPSQLQANTNFNILGVNIYRSFDSEYGPWFRLNPIPVGTTFWRDRSTVTVAVNEDVSNSFTGRGASEVPGPSDPNGQFTFRTLNKPIALVNVFGVTNCPNLNVQVTVNGQSAVVDQIDAANGIVRLSTNSIFDPANQVMTPPVLPTGANDVVLVTYKYTANEIPTNLNIKIFYRITTVAYDPATGALIETPLERAAQGNSRQVEQLDYMWREAIRRQKWLLDHGGERAKVFIRKVVGPKCGCNSSLYKQPDATCLVCFGTGIIGGYDGDYDIVLSPDDGEKAIKQSSMGRSYTHPYDTWTGPSPLLSQRDFIVKLNGDRYGLGPVRMPSNRGMQLQQFFQLSHLDDPDIRYKVPLPDPMFMEAPQTRYIVPGKGDATPMVTDNPNIPAERQIRSNSVTGSNTLY